MLQNANGEVMVASGGSVVMGKAFPSNPQNPDIGGGDPETVALAYVNNSTRTYDDDAFIDDVLRMDIDSIKDYALRANADVIAVDSRDFTDPLAWWNIGTGTQAVPGAGDNILIPQGVTVTYDQESTTVYGIIRIDGGWEYRTNGNVELHCDTIFVDHTGTYNMGTSGSPPSDTFTQKVVYHNPGPLDVTNDPVKMQRGLICFGRAGIYAAPVVWQARASAGIAVSATSVTLDRQVQGVSGFRDWKVGDEIVIPGTRMRGHCNNWEDWEYEVRTISAIDNSTPSAPVISWTTPLVYPHPAATRDATLTPHVVNRTRNFQTWTDGAPADAQRRAHQLFKNKDQNVVEYVEAWGMGRTDMDYITLGVRPEKLPFAGTMTSTTNTVGRYTWHLHRNGADDPAANPSIFRGCVGYDSPGWMYVHHDSHAEIIDCFAMDFQAVGFAGEGGGTWGQLLRCGALGNRETWKGPGIGSVKNGGHSLGDIGHGVWTNSRPLNITECWAADCSVGFGWTSRVSFELNVFPNVTAEPRAFYGLGQLDNVQVGKTFAVIEGFADCEAYSCNWGGSVAKKLAVQHHDVTSNLLRFTAWEVDLGFHTQYTSNYVFKDYKLYGFDPSNRTPGQPPYTADQGFNPDSQTVAMNIISADVQDFGQGIRFTALDGENTRENKYHKVVDTTFTNCGQDICFDNTEITVFPASAGSNGLNDVDVLTAGEVGDSSAGAIVPAYTEDSCVWDGNGAFVIAEDFSYTDSLGSQKRQRGLPDASYGWGLYVNGQDAKNAPEISKDAGVIILISKLKIETMIQQEGVWTSAAGDKVLLIPDQIGDRFSGNLTYFYTPVALRMPTAEYNLLNPTENGALGTHSDLSGISQDFTSFNPAGTPGLT